jgi:hypothetical protein
MLEPRPARRPVEIVRQVDQPAAPTAALVLDSLGRLHPATAIALILTVAGMVVGAVVAVVALVVGLVAAVAAIAGMVATAAVALAIAALALGHRGGSAR